MRVFLVALTILVSLAAPALPQQPPEPGITQPATSHFAPGYRVDEQTYVAICDSPKDKDHSDLCLQWRQAKAAERQVFWSVFAFVALIGTLFGTWVTARATKDTVATMQETARRQLRAYISIEPDGISDFIPATQG